MLEELIRQFVSQNYLVAIIYFVVFFILLRIGIFILERIVLKLTLKTKTTLDDLIIEKLNVPLTIIAGLFGVRLTLKIIPEIETSLFFIEPLISTVIIGVVLYSLYSIINLAFFRVWTKVSKKANRDSNEALMYLLGSFLKVVIIILALLYILSIWGYQIGPWLAGLGIGGIAIAFALQSSLANVFSGISIILDKSVRVGDLVNLGGVSGKILKIGLRSTKVQTFDNEIVIVPNSKLADENIHNIAQPDPVVRVVIPFGVEYGSSIEKVKKITLKEIKTVANIVEQPEPIVRFIEMADSSLNFKAYFFVNSFENRFGAIDEANTKIYNALNKNKIGIPFPQMDVHLKKK